MKTLKMRRPYKVVKNVPTYTTGLPVGVIGYDSVNDVFAYNNSSGTKIVVEQNIDAASTVEAKAGVLTTKYVTPAGLVAFAAGQNIISGYNQKKTISYNENIAGLSSSIALANALKATINAHYNDSGSGALTKAIALANSLKSKLNHHYQDEGDGGLDSAILLANDAKTMYNEHVADSGAGAEHILGDDTVDAVDATDISSLITLVTELLANYDAHDADAELAAAWVYHQDQETGDHSLVSAVAPTDLHECITALNDFKTKFNAHEGDATTHTNGDSGDISAANAAYVEEHIAEQTNVTADDATTLPTLITLTTALLSSYNTHDDDGERADSWVYHIAQEAGDVSLVSAVAPINLHECMTKLNDMKAKYNTHVADSTCHTAGDNDLEATADATYTEEHISIQTNVSVADATDIASLLALVGDMLTSYNTHDDDEELSSAWTYHVGQEGSNHTLVSTVTPVNVNEATTKLNDLKAKLNAHVADSGCHTDADSDAEDVANAAAGASARVVDANCASSSVVIWGLLSGGAGSRTGVGVTEADDYIDFEFSGDPANDVIISYFILTPAT